jgi:CBS domain-containing protein
VKIKDLMRTDVITVTPDTSLKDAAALLVEHRISGLPVVDEERTVVGVLSEADILVKEGGPSEREGLLSWVLGGDLPEHAAKLRARTVGEAMTSPPITISALRLAASAAREMVEQGINRLPVVDLHGTLVGIVTRADLVRAFVRTDAEIEREIREETLQRVLWLEPTAVTVAVHDGEVELSGRVETTDDVEIVEKLVARTPGVVAVRSQLTHRTNGR